MDTGVVVTLLLLALLLLASATNGARRVRQGDDAHSLPAMYVLSLAALVWLAASGSEERQGAAVAVALVGCVSAAFVQKLARRFGSQSVCVLAVAAALVSVQTWTLSRTG